MLIFSLKIVLLYLDNLDYGLDLKEISVDRSSLLGALGRRFESCRPEHLKSIHTSELPRLAFLLPTLRKIRLSEL